MKSTLNVKEKYIKQKEKRIRKKTREPRTNENNEESGLGEKMKGIEPI